MDTKTLISVEQLYRYYGHHLAVDAISFELSKGEVLGFLGPNGAGKSTTMQMISGNLAPSSGRICINGIDLLDQPRLAKAQIGYLPEQPPVYPDLSVDEYLQYCARLHLVNRSQLSSACDSAIERCGLGPVRQRLINNLSKGFQQRVGIAQAILHSPPVIILDEPTVGLDPIQILEIRKLIKILGESHGIILCTHILPEVQAVCNRVQIINRGKLVYTSSIEDLLHEESRQYEISLSSFINDEKLASHHHAFNTIKRIDEHRYIVDSELKAEQLTAYIVKQEWGLTRFVPHRASLEQIFIDLTAGEKSILDENMGDESLQTIPLENSQP